MQRVIASGSRGGGGTGGQRVCISQKYRGFSNTGPDPLKNQASIQKNHKATSPAFNVGPSSAASQMPFNGVSLAGR